MTRIVLADDHAMFRQGLMRLLQSADLSVVAECSDGREALDAIRLHQPDIALLDVTMPGMDGIAVAEEARASGCATRIIMLTMHDVPAVCSRALAAGVAGYILKDDAFEELETAMKTALQGKSFVSTSLRRGMASCKEGGGSVLTSREQEVLRLIARGQSNRLIAEELQVSIKTVDSHRTNLMRKLDLHSVADLVRYAIQARLA